MGHDVFLSYSTKDKSAAEAICAALEKRGIGVWMAPRNIPPGASYAASIVEAIDSARVLVLVFSGAANDSQDIEREVQRADAKRLKIVPFRLEDVEPKASLAYFLPSRQYLDAFRPPMEARYDELSDVVQQIAPPQPGSAPSGGGTPPPPPPQRFQRFPTIVGGVVALLAVTAVVVWQWPRPTGPVPAPSSPPAQQSGEDKTAQRKEPAPNPDGQSNPAGGGDYGILFGSQKEGPKDPYGPMNEIRKARQIPNSPDPVLYKKDGLWKSIVTFETQAKREELLPVFRAKFPAAKVAPVQLSVECPNRQVLAGKEGDIPEQIECVQ